jgi:mono/diheme cytochrome c family protein
MKTGVWVLLFLQDGVKQAPKIIDKPEEAGVGKVYDVPLDGAKALLVAFTSADCPLSKLYLPKIGRLASEYSARGVKTILAGCNGTRKVESELPLSPDSEALIRKLGPRRTTEVFLLDESGTLRYRGAIDDQYGIGYDRDRPTRAYLVDALNAVLSGEKVNVAATEAPGCAIEAIGQPSPSAGVTYHQHVEPILQKRCQECHRPGEIGPFPLLQYEQARAAAKRMKEVVISRRMPPWHANPEHGKFENSRRLDDAEIDTIVRWVDSGCPRGDAAQAPAPRKWTDGWTIGKPDAVFTMPRAIDIPAEGTIPYKYVRVKTDLKEDRWVRAAEIRAGARDVVHHILVFVEYPRGRRGEQPPIDGGLFHGYFAVLVPGERPVVYPEGTGKLLPAGASLIFQLHYTANGKAAKDQSSIGFVFSKEPAKTPVVTRGIVNAGIRIPAGAADHQEKASTTFVEDAKILSFLPHMHLRGKSFRYVAVHPDGREEILLDVPSYDFRWQSVYRLAEPKRVRRGTKIRCFAAYDNSAGNPANPDPSKAVRWGDQSWEEMLIGYMDFVAEP